MAYKLEYLLSLNISQGACCNIRCQKTQTPQNKVHKPTTRVDDRRASEYEAALSVSSTGKENTIIFKTTNGMLEIDLRDTLIDLCTIRVRIEQWVIIRGTYSHQDHH